MRPVSTDSDGPAPPENLSCPYPLVGSLPATEMSLLQSLGPVQSWLGQELEKCGIDAMIYTRYVLSLLLHDSYDYDLQDQVGFPYLKHNIGILVQLSLTIYCKLFHCELFIKRDLQEGELIWK